MLTESEVCAEARLVATDAIWLISMDLSFWGKPNQKMPGPVLQLRH